GFVISDAGGTGGANVLHFTTKDYAESTEQSIENGLDVIFQTSFSHYSLFYEAFEKGMVDESAIDEAVRRVLRAKFNLGLFENPYVNPEEARKWNGHSEHRKIALNSAQESIVLLKNDNKVLPLKKDLKKIAVIGTDAVEGRLGGYSGPGNNVISMLDGIKERVGGTTEINYALGCGRESAEFITIPSKNLFSTNGGEKKKGLFGEYFDNPNFEGKPKYTKVDQTLNFRWTLFSPDQNQLDYDWYSVRWSGKLVAPNSGKVKIGIKGNDGYRLYIDGEVIIDNWLQKSFQTVTVPFQFEEGKEYDIKVEFHTTTGNVWFKLLWDAEVEDAWKNQISEAVELAQNSDAAIVTVGIEEGEFRDRAYLSLPGHQEELIKEVAKTGTPVVVVLVGGSAITMNNWINDVPAILDVWYPGEAGGYAVADVLFGNYNPAGRLPITFPISVAQVPLYYNHKPTGRGDDYINLTGQPLFPFGFGLSYTCFEYSDFKISKGTIDANESTTVNFTLKNSGKVTGDEVVQLYIKDLFASVA
ncbi:MAG: glycoside hydrolase family 3 C-terminal domain-containing protein, partial [Melioribacteraceae bacterium]|nr:glycoside hydrolase family 3 C-terminal domain-containing protein [Melioribacteraceae bacterium]